MPRHFTTIETTARPSWPARVWQALRSYSVGPLSLKDPELARKLNWGGGSTSTGIHVTEANALAYSAVWSAVSLISGQVGSLPLLFYRRRADGGKERYTGHPLYGLLHDSPNPEQTSMVFREQLQAHLLLWGNAFAEIVRNGAGQVSQLWPITPDRIAPFRQDGRLKYRVRNEGGREEILEPSDVLHIPGLGFDGVVGYSVVGFARESIGLGIATEKFGATFFGNGANFGGVFEHPTRMSPQSKENFRKSINARHQGVERAHRFLVVEEGMRYQRLGIPPNDAQFLESRQFQIAEIARWFNVPPHKIGDLSHATYSNIEAQAIEFVQTTLMPWLRRWEQEINRKLVSPLERNQQFAEHNVDGILRGDAAARAAFYKSLFDMGALSPNDIRGYENMNPIEGGDTYLVQMNLQTLDQAKQAKDDAASQRALPMPVYPAARDDQELRRCHVIGQQLDKLWKQLDALGKLHLPDGRPATSHADFLDASRALERGRDDLRVFGVRDGSRVVDEVRFATDSIDALARLLKITATPLLNGAMQRRIEEALRDPAEEARQAEAKRRAEWLKSLPQHVRMRVYRQEAMMRKLERANREIKKHEVH